jgi:hypothetical protein
MLSQIMLSEADDVAQANANGVLLEVRDDVAAEEVAREYAVPRLREGRPLNR